MKNLDKDIDNLLHRIKSILVSKYSNYIQLFIEDIHEKDNKRKYDPNQENKINFIVDGITPSYKKSSTNILKTKVKEQKLNLNIKDCLYKTSLELDTSDLSNSTIQSVYKYSNTPLIAIKYIHAKLCSIFPLFIKLSLKYHTEIEFVLGKFFGRCNEISNSNVKNDKENQEKNVMRRPTKRGSLIMKEKLVDLKESVKIERKLTNKSVIKTNTPSSKSNKAKDINNNKYLLIDFNAKQKELELMRKELNKRKAQKENQLNIYIGSFVDMKSKQNQALKQDVFYEGKLLNLYYLKDYGQEFASKGHENYTVINKVMQDSNRRKLFMSYDSNENRMKWRKKKLFNLKIKSIKENNNDPSQNLNSSIVNSTNIDKNINSEKENKEIRNIDIISINNTFQSNTNRKNTDYSNKHANVLVSNSVKQTKRKVMLLNKNINSIKNSFMNNRNTNSSTKDCDLTELPSFKKNSSIQNVNTSNVKSPIKTRSVFNNFLINNKKDNQHKLEENNKLNTLNLLNNTHNSTNRSYTKLQKLGYINLSPKNIYDSSTSRIGFFSSNKENEKNEHIKLNNADYNPYNSFRLSNKKEINKSNNISKHELNKSARHVSKTNTKIDYKLRKT